MKTSRLFIVLFLTNVMGGLALAESRKPANSRDINPRQLEIELNSLNYFNSSDFSKGASKAGQAYEIVEAFAKSKKTRKEKLAEFQSIVTLVAAANPYDVETLSASSLAAIIDDSQAFKISFKNSLPSVSDSCRRQDLSVQVEEYLCQFAQDKKKKGASQDSDDGCMKKPVFNIEDCLKARP